MKKGKGKIKKSIFGWDGKKIEKNKKKTFWEHVKARMGEYYEEKLLKNLKNKMSEIEASFVNKNKILNRKKPKKTVTTVIQPI